VWHCNAAAGQVYIGLRGFRACSSFELKAEVFAASDGTPEACSAASAPAAQRALSLDADLELAAEGVQPLRFGHATLSSCASGSYQVFPAQFPTPPSSPCLLPLQITMLYTISISWIH
jgi:hypothetical protein